MHALCLLDVISSSASGQGDDVYEDMDAEHIQNAGNVNSVLPSSDVIPSLHLGKDDDTYENMNGDNPKTDGNAKSNAATIYLIKYNY